MSAGRWQWRRWTAILVVLGAGAGLVLGGVGETRRTAPVFAQLGDVQMPFVPAGQQLTDSWFCPGGPRSDQASTELVIANPTGEAMQGTVTTFSDDRAATAVVSPLAVPAFSVSRLNVSALQSSGAFVSALVEVIGGGAQVEQHTVDPNGDSYGGCSNAAANHWYFADGTTLGTTAETLQVTNPYAGPAIINLQLVTGIGTSSPVQWQGYPIAGRSVVTIDLTTLARNESIVSATVTATRGRVVAARSQRFVGSGRAGAQVSLGIPTLSNQAYFPDVQLTNGVRNQISLYNPGTEPVDVMLVPVVADLDVPDDKLTFTVDGGSTKVVTLVAGGGDIPDLPTGRFAVAATTMSVNKAPFVAELAVTSGAGRNAATGVVPAVPNELRSVRWTSVASPSTPLADAFRVSNVELNDGEIKVWALTSNGYQVIPGMEALPIPGSSSVSLDFSAVPAEFLGRPLLIDCTRRAFVQRMMPRGDGLSGRAPSIPLNG